MTAARQFLARWWLWLVLVAAWIIELAMLWGVQWLPMQDVGGHLELMDIVARHGDPGTAYADVYTVSSPFTANGLGLILNALLYPLLGTLGVAKLMLSVYVVALPASLLAVARAFDRPAWTALFAVPLTFSAFFNIGFLNFLVALPLMLAAIAVARHFAVSGGLARGAALAALLVLTYLAHVLVFLMALAMVAAVLVLFVPSWRQGLRGLPWLANLIPLVLWVAARSGAAGAPGAFFEDEMGAKFTPIDQRLTVMHAWGLKFWRDDASDEIAWIALVAVWLLAMVASLDRPRRRDDGDGAAAAPRGWRATAGGYLPEAFALGGWLAFFLLPSHFREVHVIAHRTWLVALFFFALWPRRGISLRALVPIVAPLVVLAIAYPAMFYAKAKRFEDEVVGDLPAAIAALPDGSSLAVLLADRDDRMTFMGTLWHLPKALHALANGGVTNDSFAMRPYYPVAYRPWAAPPRLLNFKRKWSNPELGRFDHVLLRSFSRPIKALATPRLKLRWHDKAWWLFDIAPLPGDRVVMAGGAGGSRARDVCLAGQHMTGLDVAIPAAGGVALRVVCGGGDGTLRRGTVRGRAPRGAKFASLLCPRGGRVVGLSGHAGRTLGDVAVRCEGADQPSPPAGVGAGQPFDLSCPDGDHLAGLQVRSGVIVDAVGLICSADVVPSDRPAPKAAPAPARPGEERRAQPRSGAGEARRPPPGARSPVTVPRRMAPSLQDAAPAAPTRPGARRRGAGPGLSERAVKAALQRRATLPTPPPQAAPDAPDAPVAP